MTVEISADAELTPALRRAIVDLPSGLGLEQLYLTCRSGTGLAEFYGLGWKEVGVMPGNLRMVDGSYRDEIHTRLMLQTGRRPLHSDVLFDRRQPMAGHHLTRRRRRVCLIQVRTTA